MSNLEYSKCLHNDCNRIATYRNLKVGNCHLKDTKYEFCGYHKPRNAINKKFPYNSIFDKINVELEYYNHQNYYIINEYNDYIHDLLKNHKFKFPIKVTAFTENVIYKIDLAVVKLEKNISHITNYENYFDKDTASQKDIFDVILKFQKYYNDKKIEMLYIHLDKEYDTYDIIREFRNYYEEKTVDDIIKEFDEDKKIKSDNIFNILINFNEYYKKQKFNKRKLYINFKKYYNKKNYKCL